MLLLCYNIFMKKMSKEKLIQILKSKNNNTYEELSKITGYHPKSLIRINKALKNNNYHIKKNIDDKIINDYLNSNYKTYKDFYKNTNYNISYSKLCQIICNKKIDSELVIIKKIKQKGNYYFEVIDYKNELILFTFKSFKNDTKSIKKIIYLILKDYGCPKKITFENFFEKVPKQIEQLLDKYNIKIVIFKSIYRNIFNKLSTDKINVKYKKVDIVKEDFYNYIIRKTIADNIIQFKNTRYKIKTNELIKKNRLVDLYYNDLLTDLFIKINDVKYELSMYKKVESKKGNMKY